MKKSTKLLLFVFAVSSFSLVSCGLNHINYNIETDVKKTQDTFVPKGDYEGGANLTYTQTPENHPATLRVAPTNQDLGEKGIYIRLKNNTGINTPINFFMNGTNGHRVGLIPNTELNVFDKEGASTGTIKTREFGNYFMLPADFDGFIYFDFKTNFASLGVDLWPGNNNTNMTYNSVFSLYFEVSTQYDAYANFILGDIFNDVSTLLDVSTLNNETFNNAFVKDYEGTYITINRLVQEFKPSGDKLGGANVTVTATTNDTRSYFYCFPQNSNGSGDGVYIRMTNNTNIVTPIEFYINSKQNHRVKLKTNETIFGFDKFGENKHELKTREFDSFIMLPAEFDGFIYIPYSALMDQDHNIWPDNSKTEMNYSEIYGFSFGIATKYDAYANFDIGDIITGSNVLLDTSEITQSKFGTYFAKDYLGEQFNFAQLDGYKVEQFDFDFSTVNYDGNYEMGANLHFKKASDANKFGVMKIKPTTTNMKDAIAFSFRLNNNDGVFPFLFNVVDKDGTSCGLGGEKIGSVYFVTNEKKVISNSWGGNPLSTFTPSSFDGNFVVPVTSLLDYANLDLENISHFEIRVAAFYDDPFNKTFGDVAFIKKDASYNKVLDCKNLNDEGFKDAYSIIEGEEYSFIKRFIPQTPCDWQGDVKILNSLKYENDEELKKEVTWNEGDNACSYSVLDDGMKVDIGPYETGHAYGSYMALKFGNNKVHNDYSFVKNDGEKTTNALGISMYVKNLSRREIGINLQFDELTSTTPERWIVKQYPAMYFAYDVKKDADYIYYAKSDQIQIPVGFEGYIRVPFTSYSVPDWCHGDNFTGTDDILNPANFSGEFFLTSDNIRYEDLSFFIKDVGCYFNETKAGSLFNKENTIKANMGL